MKFCIFTPTPPAWKTRWIFGGKFSFIFSQGKWLKICHSQNFRKFHHISLTLESSLFSFSSLFPFCGFPCFFVRFCSLFQGFQPFCREENPRFFRGIIAFFAKKSKDWRVRVSTARKEIYHLELALGATSRNYLWHFSVPSPFFCLVPFWTSPIQQFRSISYRVQPSWAHLPLLSRYAWLRRIPALSFALAPWFVRLWFPSCQQFTYEVVSEGVLAESLQNTLFKGF